MASTTMAEETNSVYPLHREKVFKHNGWGYVDSKFDVKPDGEVIFSGGRYVGVPSSLPHIRPWMEKEMGIDLEFHTPKVPQIALDKRPVPYIHEQFYAELLAYCNSSAATAACNNSKNNDSRNTIIVSEEFMDRLFRSHGHTLREIFLLRSGNVPARIPDLVVWPTCHAHVEALVKLAVKHNVVIIPYGGGTSVSGALECLADEKRTIVSLDTSCMNRIIWIDENNWTCCVEAGKVGQDLERELQQQGYTMGHEPDSLEFSTVGGWVATRASGMKKNVYGNIEDLLVHVKMVTPRGTLARNCQVPRLSAGPDLHEIIIGSEGCFGVITEAVFKIRPVPKHRKYNSLVFRDFETGVAFLHEIARQRCWPASLRLMDNDQFRFGQALKPPATSSIQRFKDACKKFYLLKWKEIDPQQMCVATLLFEGGNAEQVEQAERRVYDIACSEEFGAILAGEENGKRGYMMTFLIAYLRDLGFDYGIVSESFETSVPWCRLLDMCRNVKRRVFDECVRWQIKYPPFISCRVTQTYDEGACVYFYFGFNYRELYNRAGGGVGASGSINDPVHVYEKIEEAARDEILANGGSISHHHGVGKLRQKWLKQTVSGTGYGLLGAIKKYFDPDNIFANGNLVGEANNVEHSLEGKL